MSEAQTSPRSTAALASCVPDQEQSGKSQRRKTGGRAQTQLEDGRVDINGCFIPTLDEHTHTQPHTPWD